MLQYFSQERKLEDSQYTTEDFLFRWKKLQRILAKEGVDGLLIATGLDARDCVHSAYLFNWLFLGLSGKSITINKYLDPVYSQIIIIVSAKGSHIFITPEAKENLETLIYSIPNCTIFCPTQKEYQNKEVLDTLKIAQFYVMSEKMNKIGVFLGENEDVKIIQKWPIIQSYALEPVGRTFFTLRHQAVNLGTKIGPLFRNLDKHSLKNLVSRTAYSMEGHVKGALATIELKSQKQRQGISEASIQQSLQEAVDIGLFESGNQEYKGLVRVLFGARTQTAVASSADSTVASEKAEHFTVQHFDPYTKMKIWRSYFLNANLKNYLKVKLESREEQGSFLVKTCYQLEEVQNSTYDQQNTLILLYVSLVQSVLQSISSIAKDYRNLNNQFITKLVLGKINQTAKEIYGCQSFAPPDLVSEIESFDSFGEPRPVDFKDSISFKLTSTFYTIKLKLRNISCPASKLKLGAIIFSESFLIQEGCYLLLTKKTPYFDFWKCDSYNEILSQLNPNLGFQRLGKPLSPQGFKNRIFVPNEKLSIFHFNIPILNVKYYFHQKGLRIYNQKIGWEVLLYDEISNLTMVNKVPGVWVLLKTNRNFFFDSLQSNILAMEFGGKSLDFLLKKSQNKQTPLKLDLIQQLPQILSDNWYFTNEVMKKTVKEGAVLFQHQILVNDFLWSFIEAKQLMIINQMKDIKMATFKAIYQAKFEKKKQSINAPLEKHSIMVLDGTYGSGKYNLAKTLKRFGPNEVPCEIFKFSTDNIYKKVPSEIFIETIQQYITKKGISKTVTLIVILPSWINASEILPLLCQKFHIRSVLTKINAGNFFANKNGGLTQNVLTFALPGYSQNIVVDAYGEQQSLINNVIKIIGSYNRESNVFRSNNCLLTTGQCFDIMLNNSYHGQYQSFLRQKYGSLYTFDLLSGLEIKYVQFKLPLHDIEPFKNLSDAQGYLIDKAALLRELLPKKKQAEGSKDQLMLGLYYLQEMMSTVRRREKAPQIRSIRALVKIKQEDQATEIRQIIWSNQYFRQEQIKIPEIAQRTLGFSIICRRFSELQIRDFIQSLSFKKVLFGEPQIMKSIQGLSPQEIESIQKWAIENQRFLDEGFYYDGYVLRNENGFSVERHPNLQKAVEGWIAEQNARVVKFNGQLRTNWNEYVANYKGQ